MNIEEIKENYSRFSDAKIENIAATKTQSLPKEVIDVLNEEIKKRNLSPNLSADFDAMDQQRKAAEEYAQHELIHGHQIFYEKKNGRLAAIFALGITALFLFPLLGSIVNGFMGIRIGPIFKYAGYVFGAYTLFKYVKDKPVLVETFDNYMIVAQNPLPYRMGKIGMLINVFKLMHNNINRFQIFYKDIEHVYREEGFFSDKETIIKVIEDGTPIEFPSSLNMIEKEDKQKVIQILKSKGVKVDLEA